MSKQHKKTRNFHAGMGQAVAERTILRKKEDGKWETWADVANRVALGNSLLCKDSKEQQSEYEALQKHLTNATTLMSGRHLQHGDESQPERNMEVYTNCSTSSTSFMLFYLLMNGSGVGRSYDDDMMLVDWDNAPALRCVLSETHPNFDFSAHESVRDAKHKYGSGKDVLWHLVEDTREGWAKALEIWENAAFEKIHKDKLFILDFSNVRQKGAPIKGMQKRPASGPVPLMNAFNKAATLKATGLPRWMQTIYIDHYFAECVLVGGARRAARMSTKTWRDDSVLEFITIKRPIEFANKSVDEITELRKQMSPMGFLWSSNNSIAVDQEFWTLLNVKKGSEEYSSELAKHARNVYKIAVSASYGDGTGEPGFINVDKLNQDKLGTEKLVKESDSLVGSKKYSLNEDTGLYINRLLKKAVKKQNFMITNPCVSKDTWVTTKEGPRQVKDLINKPFYAIVNGESYLSTGFFKTGDKVVYEVTTDRGYKVKITDNHKLMVEKSRKRKLNGDYKIEKEWKELKDINVGEKIVITNQENNCWEGEGTFHHGWLIGEIVGDGGYNPEKYTTYLRFWGESSKDMANFAVSCLENIGVKTKKGFEGSAKNKRNNTIQTSCVALNSLAEGLIEPLSKNLTCRLEKTSSEFYRGFIRGIFDADGTVCSKRDKGRSVRLSQVNLDRLQTIQRMLSRLGIASTIYKNRKESCIKKMPDGKGGEKKYKCLAIHDLVISKNNIELFFEKIGFSEVKKMKTLKECIQSSKRNPYKERFTARIESVEKLTVEPVYDCVVDDVHCFDANGILAHNCGEISIAVWGAFCTIADVVPYHAETLEEAEDAFRCVTRALIRVNTMDSVYRKEVKRTNRIGVGITGVHEFAWKFFKLGFKDLVDEEKSKEFWLTLARFKRAVQDEAREYSKKIGVNVPHSDTTIKPAGTTSKLFGLTEGWHLPSMRWYMRWVQFSKSDPLIKKYSESGYPMKELTSYQNTVIIGFPTTPVITELGMEDALITAGEASPEEQYKWLMLGEKYWIRGVDVDGNPLDKDTGNQISYTLKYNPSKVDFKNFCDTLKNSQSLIKCCSVMPQEDRSSYEYLPEESVTKAEYENIVRKITSSLQEDVDRTHIDCAGGACPVDFKKEL